MAVNTYKQSEKRKKNSFFGWLSRLLQIDESYEEVIHVRFLPQIIFIAILCVLYIANRHSAEKKVRAISQLEVQVEDLRADFTTLKASYMFASKQSEVAKRAKDLGLTENKKSPILISIE
ncbi:MAG: hypothetical protein GY816_09590 [Cytophagales bacterium]|nr:hypothetical protein [Cytophagales bacterium]